MALKIEFLVYVFVSTKLWYALLVEIYRMTIENPVDSAVCKVYDK